jgi:hypothetical protein
MLINFLTFSLGEYLHRGVLPPWIAASAFTVIAFLEADNSFPE